MIRILVGLLLLLSANTLLADRCVPGIQNLSTRPAPEAGPTDVKLFLYVNDIIAIDDAGQSFTSDVIFRVEWKDARLAHDGPGTCSMEETDIWTPGLQLVNRRSVERVRQPDLAVSTDGTVSRVVRGFGDFSFRADLSRFPFDQQQLSFNVISQFGVDEVHFVTEENQLGIARQLSVANWAITLRGAQTATEFIVPLQRELARVEVFLDAHRLSGYYLWQQLVPLFLVVMMTWVVFWIPLEFVPSRVGLASTAMLTLIAYRFAMSSVLPPIAYLTRLDLFVIGSSVLVFCALAGTVTVTFIAENYKKEDAERIDFHARWLLPLLYILVAAVTFGT